MNSTSATLRCRTAAVRLRNGLLELLAQLSPSGAWIRESEGFIGLGVAASTTTTGAGRFADLASFWDSLGTDEEAVAFVSATFSPASEYASRLVLPEVLIRHEAGGTEVLVFSAGQEPLGQVLARHDLRIDDHGMLCSAASPAAQARPASPALLPGAHTERQYLNAVAAGLSAVQDGTVEKLVLARDVLVSAQEPVHTGAVLARLAEAYPQTWTYCVAAAPEAAQTLLGATPEMLVRVRGPQVSSRVLAGTIDHAEAPETLLQDTKQHREHRLAVASLLDQLEPVTETLTAPAAPRLLELPNLYHLASDLTGTLATDSDGDLPSPLLVAEAAHPTAAVCGTPTATAAALIAQLEGIDRGPYAGPVGWIDTRGNADFGIALRGGVFEDEHRIRLFAGCGVVEGSEPESELAETRVKLKPMLWALGLDQTPRL